MLKYALIENPLTGRPNDYSAQVYATKTVDKERFIELLLRKGTLMTRTDLVAAMSLIEDTVVEILEDGGCFNLPLFNTSFTISGIFDGPADLFDERRHKLNIKINKGVLLREAEKRLKKEKTEAVPSRPVILAVKDCLTGKTNEVLASESLIEVWGYNIKIVGDEPECGLWFVSEDGAEEKASMLIDNKPSLLRAFVPLLASGTYRLKVVTRYTRTGRRIVNKPKQCVYAKPFIV